MAAQVSTPPTPSRFAGSPKSHRRAPAPRGLLLPLVGPNGNTPTPLSAGGAGTTHPPLCTPADADEHHTPPAELRRESLIVPPSDRLVRVARGSGVSVYRMDRSPRGGEPRSPWVLKKACVSPLMVRERRRVERTLEHESLMLSQMCHPHIVGFRAAQRLNDGHVCLALEHCELSLYGLIQERASPDGGCISPARTERAVGFAPAEVASIGRAVASALEYLHTEHRLMHGDVKSANILLSRDLSCVKVCDLGVSIPLRHDLSEPLQPGAQYEGTEPWRPPETLLNGRAGDFSSMESDDDDEPQQLDEEEEEEAAAAEARLYEVAEEGEELLEAPPADCAGDPDDEPAGEPLAPSEPAQHLSPDGRTGGGERRYPNAHHLHHPHLDHRRRQQLCRQQQQQQQQQQRQRRRSDDAETMRLCDRTDVFAFGLVVWEMLSGDVPHAARLPDGEAAYRAALGTRPPLPPLPDEYAPLEAAFLRCTVRQPPRRPSAAELVLWLTPGSGHAPPPIDEAAL